MPVAFEGNINLVKYKTKKIYVRKIFSSSSYMALQLLYRVLVFSINSFHLLLSWARVFQFGTFISCYFVPLGPKYLPSLTPSFSYVKAKLCCSQERLWHSLFQFVLKTVKPDEIPCHFHLVNIHDDVNAHKWPLLLLWQVLSQII